MVFEVSGDWEDGSTDGRPDEFVWELGFLLEVCSRVGLIFRSEFHCREKSNAKTNQFESAEQDDAIAFDAVQRYANKADRRQHEHIRNSVASDPSNSSLTFDASLSESSVGKRGCGWVWRVLGSASPCSKRRNGHTALELSCNTIGYGGDRI